MASEDEDIWRLEERLSERALAHRSFSQSVRRKRADVDDQLRGARYTGPTTAEDSGYTGQFPRGTGKW